MNKVFKVIWNYATQSWVAVSELQKTKGKSASKTDKRVAVTALATMGAFTISGAYAATAVTVGGTQASSSNSPVYAETVSTRVAVGLEAIAPAEWGTAIGARARAIGSSTVVGYAGIASADSTAIGGWATAGMNVVRNANSGVISGTPTESGRQAVALGYKATATGDQSLAIGGDTKATGAASVAIGGDDLDAVSRYNLTGSPATAINGGSLNSEFRAISGINLVDGTNNQTQYPGTTSSGQGSVAIGVQAVSAGHLATALGTTSSAAGMGSTAFGIASHADARGSIAGGPNAKTTQGANEAIALGAQSLASAQSAVAIANTAQATKNSAIAVGQSSEATGNYSIALGSNTTASAEGSTAIGLDANVSATNGVALGVRANVTATGIKGVAIGEDSTSANEKSIAIGAASKSSGDKSIAIGDAANATNTHSFAIGGQSFSNGTNAMAIGSNSKALANFTVALGNAANASAEQAQALGVGSVANGTYATAVGSKAIASATNAFAGGREANATASHAVALGNKANALAGSAIAIGNEAKANGTNSIATGWNATATGGSAIATGREAQATADHAIASGSNAGAAGTSSIALGQNAKAGATGVNNVIAIGTGATANVTAASGVAIGHSSSVSSNNAVALGMAATVAAGFERAVALGSSSSVSAAVDTASTTLNGVTYGVFAGSTPDDGDVVSVGNDSRKRQIQNVAAGRISSSSTDAINGSQLYATNIALGNLANSVKTEFGGNAALNPNGTVTFSNIGNTGKDNIHDAIAAVKENVVAGSNVVVTPVTAANGSTTYTVHGKDTTASVAQGSTDYVTVVGTPNTNTNVTNYAVGLTDKAIKDFTKDEDTITGVMNDDKGYVSVSKNPQAREDEDITYTVGLTDKAIKDFTKDDNTQATVKAVANSAITVAENATRNANGTIQYDVGVNVDDTTIKIVDGKLTAEIPAFNDTDTKTGVVAAAGAAVTAKLKDTANEGDSRTYEIDLSETTKNQIKKEETVKAGTNIASVTEGTNASGAKEFTVNANGTTVSNGSDKVKVTSTAKAGNITDYAVDLSDTAKESLNKADSAVQSFTTSVNGQNAETINQNNKDVNFVNGTGTTARAAGSDITFDVNKGNLATDKGNVTSTVAGDNFVTGDNVANAINNAVASAKEKVVKGTNVVSVDTTVDQTTGATTYTINAKDTTATHAKSSEEFLTVSEAQAQDNNVNNYETKLTTRATDALKAAETAVQNFKTQVNGTDVQTVANGHSVNFVSGTGTTARADGQNITFDVKTSTITNNATDGKATAAEPNNFATAGSVAQAINNAGFIAKSSASAGEVTGNKDQLIKTGENVTLDAGKNIKITQADGKFTFATKDQVQFDKVTTNTIEVPTGTNPTDKPITITKDGINAGGKQIKEVADGVNGKDAVNVDQLKASKWTLQTSQDKGVAATVGDINANDTVVIDGTGAVKVTNTAEAGTTSKVHIAVETAKISSNTTDGTAGTGDNGSTTAPSSTALATAGDVINAVNNVFWKVAEKGTEKDQVKAGDTIDFIDGSGTKVAVQTDAGKKVTNVTFNLDTTDINVDNRGNVTTPTNPNQVATAATVAEAIKNAGWNAKSGGNKATGDDKDATLISTGEEVEFNAGDNLKVKRQGNVFTYETAKEVTFNKVTSDRIEVPTGANPTDKPITITKEGIDAADKPISNINNGLTKYENTNTPKDGLVNLENPSTVDDKTAATVGDLRNMGWVVSSDKTTGNLGERYADDVRNANEVKFVGTGLATVSGKTENDIRTITVDVNAQNVVNNAQTPVVYTDKDGNKLVKAADGEFYPADKVNENGTLKAGTTAADKVNKGDVIASMNNGGNSTNAPTTLSNVNGNLTPTYNQGDNQIGDNGKPGDTKVAAPTTVMAEPTADQVKSMYNNAATVGDVLNAGWNLQENGGAKDFVKAYDTVNFINGSGTTANVTMNADGSVANVKFDINTATITSNTANGTATASEPNNFVTAGDVAQAVNNAGFIAKVTQGDGEAVGSKDQLIKTGETVTLDAGKNIKITQSDGKFTFATKDDVQFNNVTVAGNVTAGDTLLNKNGVTINNGTAGNPVSLTKDGLDNGGNKVTNVADGAVTNTSSDAINGSQLYDVIEKGFKIAADNGEDDTVSLNQTVAYRSASGNIITSVSDNKIDFDLANKIVVGNNTGAPVTIDGTTGTIGGLTNKDWNPDNITSGQAATEDQLKEAVANSGLKFEGDKAETAGGVNTFGRNNQEIAKVLGGAEGDLSDKNIGVVSNGVDTLTVKLAKELKALTSAEFTDPAGNTTKIGGDGITITPSEAGKQPVSLTTTGLNNGNNQITNVAAGATTKQVETKPQGNTGNAAPTTLTNLEGSPASNALTVADAKNMGFKVSASGNDYLDVVKNDNEVKFIGTGLATVTGATTDGVREITVDVNAQNVVEAAQIPVVYTNATGDKLYKQEDGTFNTKADGTGNKVNPADVIASMNSGDNTTNTPTTLSNVKSNLADVAAGDKAQPNANSPDTLADKKNNAATVGDVLNAGWNLQGNGEAVDTVVHNDTVDFVDGKGTKVTVEKKDGKNTIKVDSPIEFVNKDNPADASTPTDSAKLTGNNPVQLGNVASGVRNENGTTPEGKERATAISNASGDTLGNAVNVGDLQAATNAAKTKVDGDQGVTVTSSTNDDGSTTYTVAAKTDGTTIKVENGNITANTSDLGNNTDGTVKAPTQPNALVTSQTVADAINNAGFTLKTSAAEGEKLSGDDEVIKPGSTIDMVAGKNLTVKQDAEGKVTYATADDVKFNSIDMSNGTANQSGKITNLSSSVADKAPVSDPKAPTTAEQKAIAEAVKNATGDSLTNAVNLGDLQAATNAATTKVEQGDNIVVTPTTNGDGSTTYKVATAKDLVVDSVKAGNTTVNNDGVKVGDISVTNAPITVDGNTVNNVNEAINQTAAQAFKPLTFAGDSGKNVDRRLGTTVNMKGGVTDATKLSDNNIGVVANGTDTLEVKLAKDIKGIDSIAVNNGPTINGNGINMNGDKITNVGNGDISPNSKDAVNGSQLNSYTKVNGNNIGTDASGAINIVNGTGTTITSGKAGEVKVNVNTTDLTVSNGSQTNNDSSIAPEGTLVVQDPNGTGAHYVNAKTLATAVNNVSWKVDSEKDEATANAATKNTYKAGNNKVKAGETVKVNAGRNVEISGEGKNLNVAVSNNPEFESVKVGDKVNISKSGINAGGTQISNVAAGTENHHAVNVGQLKGAVNNLNNKINRNQREARAGIAGAAAIAGLPEIHLAGKSMVAAASSTYKGQNAVAVGYSRLSDNSKIKLKISGSADTQGDFIGTIGVGYAW